jgi:hypothetical protein
MGEDTQDVATLSAIGVLAAMAAALAHEAVGHGGACLLEGGEITLLSVIWFRCFGGSAVTDLAGPLGSLMAGLGGLALAAWTPRAAVRARLFGMVLSSFALFWFSAQLVSDAIFRTEDWGSAALRAQWPPEWRGLAAGAGMAAYLATMYFMSRLAMQIGRGAGGRRRFLIPYVAGAAALIACASFRFEDGSTLETAKAVALAPLGYAWAVLRPSLVQGSDLGLARSWAWIVTGVAGLLAYGSVFGPGVGRLA